MIKNKKEKIINNTYTIGDDKGPEGLSIGQRIFMNRFEGKNEKVTFKITEVSADRDHPKFRILQDEVEVLSPKLKIIERIRNRVSNDYCKSPPIHNDLYSLLETPEILLLAHAEIRTNDGANTGGPTGQTVDGFSLERINKISKKIKDGTFKWKGTRHIEIPRPGKKPRPLGIPDYDDKLVQFGIKIILEAIYDPIFKRQNLNNGFISHRGCHNNMLDIMEFKNKGLNMVLEGDIEGAFDNVNHEILIKILNKRIQDKKFLKLIYDACKAGKIYFKQGKSIHTKLTELGTPQGSIMSPFLFNIYMNEFDEFVQKILIKELEIDNKKKKDNTIFSQLAKLYTNRKSIIDACRKGKNKLALTNNSEKLTKPLRDKLKKYNLRIQLMKKRSFKIRSKDPEKTPDRLYYSRYADDFLMLTNMPLAKVEQIKEKSAQFLNDYLKLTLSEKKTLITNILKEPVYFLGFKIYMSKRPPRTNCDGIVQRGHSESILTGIDMDRRIKNLITKKYANEGGIPREAPHLVSFEPQEIINLYNATIDGLVNYYYRIITNKSELNRLIYILTFSCLKTLAFKFKISIRKLLIHHAWPEYNTKRIKTNRIRLIWKYEIDGVIRYTILRNYTDAMDMGKWVALAMNAHKLDDELLINNDYWNFYKLNWRTKFKYSTLCSICGKEGELESHHVRKISGIKNKNKMLILQKLNRKQIIVCKPCHQKIHAGLYNGIKIKDLSDIRLMQVDSLMLSETTHYNYIRMLQKGIIIAFDNDKFYDSLKKFYNLTDQNLKPYKSKAVVINILEGIIINHKEKAQKPQKETHKSTAKNLKILANG